MRNLHLLFFENAFEKIAFQKDTMADELNIKQKGEQMITECLLDVFFREEIDSYSNDYISMMEYGEKVTADPSTFDDPQYMFLRERLKALQDGWEEVHQMWENRLQLLSQSLNLQMFERDARQAEVKSRILRQTMWRQL